MENNKSGFLRSCSFLDLDVNGWEGEDTVSSPAL